MNRLARWLRHFTKTPQSVDTRFPSSVRNKIQDAIAEAERVHSGEIRFAIESALPWNYLRRNASVRERAEMVFSKLRVWDTEDNNGVLLYVELADHRIEIVADRGIARHVSDARWQEVTMMMREQFRGGQFEAGSIAGVRAVSAILAERFRLPDGARNPNQLPDTPTVL